MGNEGQQPPQQGQPGQPGQGGQYNYYGWQYEQDSPDAMQQQSPAMPHIPNMPEQPLSPKYQEPIADMGTSLGYGQGQEYQFSSAPQPSQPMPVLRQARLQQLREERMRRQQRRMGGQDVTRIILKQALKRPPEGKMPPSNGMNAPLAPPQQFSPVVSMPPIQERGASPDAVVDQSLRTAAETAQDTGMIQRVNVRRATFILTGAFILSRILGLLRTSMFAIVFGAGAISDAYLQAFVIPDTIFNMVAGGALSSAFIPVFTQYMIGKRDEKSAWHIASSALNLAIAIMVILALIVFIFAPAIIPLYNPRTSAYSPPHAADYSVHINLIVSLTRIMLLQTIVLGSGVIVNGVLNARQNFLLPATGTVLYNVGLIVGLLPGLLLAFSGHRNDTTAVYFATAGVVLGAVLQVGIQIPGLFKVGMHFTFSLDWRNPGVIQIGRQMIPRIINAGMLSFSTLVDRLLISLLGAVVTVNVLNGLVTEYYQAFTLLMLPLGIFGMAVSTAAFPTMAENVAKGRLDRVRSTILETLRNIIFMSIPSSIGLIILGLPVIQVLLQHGAYTLSNAEATAVPLGGFAIGLTGLAAVEILTRAFYALRDSVTPVIVSVGQFIFKIALSLILIDLAVFGVQWGTGALALSTSLAGLIEAVVLIWLLHKRIGGLELRQLWLFIGRVLAASAIMGVGLLIVRFGLDFILSTNHDRLGFGDTLLAAIKLVIEMFVGLFIYVRVSRKLGIEEMGAVTRLLARFKLSWI